MVSAEEMVLFIKEIYLLINEYKRCNDAQLKELIKDDIMFFSEILKIGT